MIVSEAAGTLRAFVDLLCREQTLLAEGDVDALPPLLAEKSVLTERLNGMSSERDEDFRKLAAEARALNEANGKLIALRMQHNQQALTSLMAAADRSVTYGPDGQQRVGSGRSLGKA